MADGPEKTPLKTHKLRKKKNMKIRTLTFGKMSYSAMRVSSKSLEVKKLKKFGEKNEAKHGEGSVMVWGCFSAAEVGELDFIDTTMNA